MEADRRLAVAARPARVSLHASEDGLIADPVHFTMYANYSHYIDRAEVRIFDASESREGSPLAVVALSAGGSGEWQASVGSFVAPTRELRYVLRAYGKGETFDETIPQPLWLVYADGAAAAIAQSAAAARTSERDGPFAAPASDAEAPFDLLFDAPIPDGSDDGESAPSDARDGERRAGRRRGRRGRGPRRRAMRAERRATERRRRVTAARVRGEPARPPQHSARERLRDRARQRDSGGP